MELALRRSYGYAYGMRGLGDTGCDDQTIPDPLTGQCGDGTYPTSIPTASLVTDESGNQCLASLFVNGECPASAVAGATSATVTPISTPISTTLTTTPTTAAALCPDGSPPWSDGSCVTCSDGSVPWSDGSCGAAPATAGAVSANSVAAIAAALAKAVTPTAAKIAGGVPTCPAGYVYGAAGQSVTIAPGVSTVGTGKCLPSTAVVGASIIAGVSNTTLAIGVVVFLTFLMAMGSKGKR